MAKQRIPVGPLAPPPKITPRATPVDTFHRPDEVLLNQGPTEMEQLAHALGDFQPTLMSVAVNAKNRDNLQQANQADQDVLRDKKLQTVKALGDAVRNGQLPAARNPAYLAAAKRQVYRIEGERYDTALRAKYAESDARNTDDISSFVGGFTQKYLEDLGADGSDPDLAAVLTPAIERSQSNLASAHRAERDAAFEQKVLENTDTEIGLLLDHMDETGGDPQGYAKSIHAIVQEQYQHGLSGTKGNVLMAKAIARKAEERKDTGFLDLIDMIPGGAGGTLAQIGSVKDIRRDAEARIYSKIEDDDRVAVKQTKLAKETATNEGLGQGLARLLDNPAADVSDLALKLATVGAAEEGQKLLSWRQAAINADDNVVEDPDTVTNLTYKVMSGNSSIEEVGAARAEGLISKETARGLAKELPRAADYRSILRDPTMAEAHKKLGLIIQKSDENATEVDIERSRRAQTDFLRIIVNWKASHPNATEREIIDETAATQDSLIRMYSGEVSKTADDATEMTYEVALLSNPETVPWQKQNLFESREAVVAAAVQYNTDKSGPLAELAAHVNAPVMDVYNAQLVAATRKANAKAGVATLKK